MFSYLGSKKWNDIVYLNPKTLRYGLNELMDFLKHWEVQTGIKVSDTFEILQF